MIRSILKAAALAAMAFLACAPAYAQNEFVTPTAGKTVIGTVVMCQNTSSPPAAVPCSAATPLQVTNSGGGGGAITAASGSYAAGAFSAGAAVDGWDLTQGLTTDAAATAGGTGTVSAKLREISGQLNTALPLPTGAATSANQNATAAGVSASNAQGVQGVTGGIALPISAAALPLPSGAATAANQNVATENHLGEVGGNQITVQVAQTVTASSAYASGNAIGGLMTIANAARVSGASGASGTGGLLQSVIMDIKSAQTTPVDIVVFNANPTTTTCTDKTAFAVAAADFDKVLGIAHMTDFTSDGTPSTGQSQNLAMPYALTSNTTLYACAVTRSTPTYAATTDVSFGFRFLRN